jgi:hypothetical protein
MNLSKITEIEHIIRSIKECTIIVKMRNADATKKLETISIEEIRKEYKIRRPEHLQRMSSIRILRQSCTG